MRTTNAYGGKPKGNSGRLKPVDSRCAACMIVLRPQFLKRKTKTRRQGVTHRESCGRIVMYNPPVAFEDKLGPAAATTA